MLCSLSALQSSRFLLACSEFTRVRAKHKWRPHCPDLTEFESPFSDLWLIILHTVKPFPRQSKYPLPLATPREKFWRATSQFHQSRPSHTEFDSLRIPFLRILLRTAYSQEPLLCASNYREDASPFTTIKSTHNSFLAFKFVGYIRVIPFI